MALPFLLMALLGQVPLAVREIPQKSPPPPKTTPAAKSLSDPKGQPPPSIPKLKSLIEAAENAIKDEGNEDWDLASDRCDEAELLIAAWPDALLKEPQVPALLDRLRQVQKQLDEDDAETTVQSDPGLMVTEEVVTLSGEDLRAERERVKAAEQGAVFDFPIDLNDKVLSMVRTLTTEKRGFMENALSRASQWMPMIRQVFAEEGIPQDLAYLAVIESGFRNEARSHAAAVGMWQFIRSTGRIYGLNGNAWVEERRDPVKATRAAARYLKRLREVSGDWYLALAGYNAGPLTPERAIQALGTRNFWDIYRSRFLRNETKNYVPSLCAAILVGRFPERYGLNAVQLRPYVFESVDIERQTSLTVIARYAGTDVATLRELNPELLRATTPPGRYTLRVPPNMAVPTARALAKLPSQQLLDFKSYVIRRGDTLSKVASRFKVTEEDLLATNSLSRSQFRQGRRIQVPPPAAIPIDDRDLMTKAEHAKVLSDQPLPPLPSLPGDSAAKPPTAPTPAPPKTSETLSTSAVPRFYQVQPGDTLASIARAFSVALPEMERLNPEGLKGLKPGESVHLPDASAPQTHAAAPVRLKVAQVHSVKRKETLFSIATRYGVSAAQLRNWNHLRSNRVGVGQRLKVSGD